MYRLCGRLLAPQRSCFARIACRRGEDAENARVVLDVGALDP